MSYVERALSWYLKNKVFGGLKKLKKKEYLPFTFISFFFMAFNTIMVILYLLNIASYSQAIQNFLILELFISMALILSGVLIGKVKSELLYFLIPISLLLISIVLYLFLNWSSDQSIFQYIKLIILFIWIAISSASLFVLTLYFFTSFAKKIITVGIPKDHVFFGWVIKAVLFISIPIYLYMVYLFDLPNFVFGLLGLLSVMLTLFLVYNAPKEEEQTPGIINFATATGFFYIIMFYHLVMSFSDASDSITSVILDLLILLVSLLYIVQSLTRRISESPEKDNEFENPISFQSRLYITDRLKNAIGEKGLVLIVLGLATAYHMVYLDSFFNPDIPLLSIFISTGASTLTMSAIYHRVYLIISFMIMMVAWYLFHSSKRFQLFMTDKFTPKQVFKYFFGYFQRPEDGLSPIEYKIQDLGKKMGENLKSWQEKVKNKFFGTEPIDQDPSFKSSSKSE